MRGRRGPLDQGAPHVHVRAAQLAQRFFELAWEKYPQHFAVIRLGSVTGLRPSSLYALRRGGENADVKWDQGLPRDMKRSELLFPSEVGGFRSNSALTTPFKVIAEAMGLTKQISPKAMRRSFQDAMREVQVANVVVRSISGHLAERMQQPYSTAQGHEQAQAIARIVDLTPRSGT